MTVGQCFTHDEYGRDRKQRLVQSGRGRLVSYPDPLSARAYRDIIERLLAQAGVPCPVRIEGSHGEPLWGVNARAVEHKGKLLVNLLNLSRQPIDLRLAMRSSPKRAFDLINGKELEFPLTIRPLDPVLLTLASPTR